MKRQYTTECARAFLMGDTIFLVAIWLATVRVCFFLYLFTSVNVSPISFALRFYKTEDAFFEKRKTNYLVK